MDGSSGTLILKLKYLTTLQRANIYKAMRKFIQARMRNSALGYTKRTIYRVHQAR
ncbi:MAG: hypothetical protein ACFFD4_19355 [Candidatus Odinarchaeota archaeon]